MIRIRVVGADRLATACDRAAADLADLSDPAADAAAAVARRAKALAPKRTGRLTGSIRASGSGPIGRATATARRAPYVEYGTRYMRAQPYMRPALSAAEKPFIDYVDSVTDRI